MLVAANSPQDLVWHDGHDLPDPNSVDKRTILLLWVVNQEGKLFAIATARLWENELNPLCWIKNVVGDTHEKLHSRHFCVGAKIKYWAYLIKNESCIRSSRSSKEEQKTSNL